MTVRLTYSWRRITVILNRQLRSEDLAPINHKKVFRIMQARSLLLARKYTERPEHVRAGEVNVTRSNLHWCSDGFEFTCRNEDIVRGTFIIDAHDREIIAWRAVVKVGISQSDIRDIMLETVERRFETYRAPSVVEMLTDNGSPYITRDTQIFARHPGLKPCFTPVRSPQGNGMSEAFLKMLQRDYVQLTPLPDAQTVLGLMEGDNNIYPHSGLKMRSPREFSAAQTASA